jgi:Raf kinase inhibitor-like YbhB/YbcL family protein
MKITSSAFEHNGNIPLEYSCDGANVAPPLLFDGVPATAQSLIVMLEDPDVSSGSWTHWLIWNIPANAEGMPSGTVLPGAAEGNNSFGGIGYRGPCPPSQQKHRYFFKLIALDTRLELGPGSSREDLERGYMGHVLAEAEMVGYYQKPEC